ncbi:MAG: hypothetical protein WCD47_23115 [Candidatus Sulfotelmatobacter sp.]
MAKPAAFLHAVDRALVEEFMAVVVGCTVVAVDTEAAAGAKPALEHRPWRKVAERN